jgi:hypothetical protein
MAPRTNAMTCQFRFPRERSLNALANSPRPLSTIDVCRLVPSKSDDALACRAAFVPIGNSAAVDTSLDAFRALSDRSIGSNGLRTTRHPSVQSTDSFLFKRRVEGANSRGPCCHLGYFATAFAVLVERASISAHFGGC